MLGSGSDTARKGLVTHLAVTQKLVEKGYDRLAAERGHLFHGAAKYLLERRSGLKDSPHVGRLSRLQAQ